ncbi:MAG: DUF1015 family protein [Acidobacteria bacterium]|nr:DUF1015 family protein [Acidobacteriota bacterium]
MSLVKPFRALRPLPEQAAEVAAVPYDVVNAEEARKLAAGNPLSFLRVSRSEIELPEQTDPYSDEVYQRAAANFDRLIASAPLIIEDEPAFYLYQLRTADHEQIGLVASCSIDEYDKDLIRKHERTRQDKEDDRTRHMLSLRAQTGPVFLTYRSNNIISQLFSAARPAAPLFNFVAEDGIAHTLWRVPVENNDKLINAFAEVPLLYIADGHHRAKSASRARQVLRDGNLNHTGLEEYNFFQCVLFPSDQVRILPYNRVVKDLNHQTPEKFFNELGREFDISENGPPSPTRRGQFSLYLGGRWYRLKLKSEVTRPLKIIDRLDVSVLQDRVIAPILGIHDLRSDKRIDFIGGIRGPEELKKLIDQGKGTVAFSLYPLSLDELMQVSDDGQIMPPKSTWFEPKLRDGLLSHLI